MPTIFLGCDHAGISLKQALLAQLTSQFPDWKFEDCGTHGKESVDYPDFARRVAERVATEGARGILICGSGIGMSIAANKIIGIRAALAWDATSARLSRQHNDANILCLGERLTGIEVAAEAARVWLTTEFLEGRHRRRVDLIKGLESC